MHAYTHTGEARHTQPTTSKDAKNATRDTNITDCKNQGLLPGVSDILDRVLAEPGLVQYKLMQVAGVCFDAPPIGGENREEYVKWAIKKGGQAASEAAELGTRIHAALENHYLGKDVEWDMMSYVAPAVEVVSSLGVKVGGAETVLTNPEFGYAGTTDLMIRHEGLGILDFKSKKTKPGEGIKQIDNHALQVAAYHMACYGEINDPDWGCNVYISTTEPGRVEVIKWDAATLRTSWDAFQHCLALYRWRTGYDARVKL
jgi:hypothetical protein